MNLKIFRSRALLRFAAFATCALAMEASAQRLEAPRGNVLIFEADPFLTEGAVLLGGFFTPDWTSTPAGLPGPLTVVAESQSSAGLGKPTVVALGPVPAGARFALVNQLAPDIAVFNYSGRVIANGDADGNGLNDAWEQRFGLHDPNADADGDGFTNKQEHDAGTNPLEAKDHPEEKPLALAIGLAEGAIQLNWTDPKAALEEADAVNGPWKAVAGANSPFTPAVLGQGKFFRLVSKP